MSGYCALQILTRFIFTQFMTQWKLFTAKIDKLKDFNPVQVKHSWRNLEDCYQYFSACSGGYVVQYYTWGSGENNMKTIQYSIPSYKLGLADLKNYA